jgi:hypothetical protein
LGRDQEPVGLDELLTTDRLVTMIGPAGVGKTSLAMARSSVRARSRARQRGRQVGHSGPDQECPLELARDGIRVNSVHPGFPTPR